MTRCAMQPSCNGICRISIIDARVRSHRCKVWRRNEERDRHLHKRFDLVQLPHVARHSAHVQVLSPQQVHRVVNIGLLPGRDHHAGPLLSQPACYAQTNACGTHEVNHSPSQPMSPSCPIAPSVTAVSAGAWCNTRVPVIMTLPSISAHQAVCMRPFARMQAHSARHDGEIYPMP